MAKRLLDQRAVARVKLVTPDFSLVDARSRKSSRAVAIEAFDGVTLILDKERIEERAAGNYTWYGSVRGYAKGRAILTVVDGYMAGSIFLLDDGLQTHGIYEIVPLADGAHALQEMNQSSFQIEEPEHRHAPPTLSDSNGEPSMGADAPGFIDVMVVYSNQTAVAAGAAIGAQIQTAIDNTNQIYLNSGVTQRLRLVHYEQVSYDEHGSDVFGTALTDLTGSSDGQMDNVHALRNTYGADLVSMFIENGGYCGIAWIGPQSSYGFSVVNRGCAISNSTFAHELGHNMGAMHDPYQVSVGGEGVGPYANGYGYVNLTGRFRTVMAYDSQCQANGFSCTRIPYVSNPNLLYSGAPIGGSTAGYPSMVSDVASVLNTTAPTVANFRQSVSACTYGVTPTGLAPAVTGGSGTVGVTSGASCAWSAASNAGWLSVTAGASGSGNGSVAYSVAANSGPARSGTLTIAGQALTFNQASGCSYALNAASAAAGAGGAAGSVGVVTGAGCTWAATSNAAWVTVTGGSSGSGNGSVAYTVTSNGSVARSGTITAAGQTFTVNQAAVGATYSLSATTVDFGEQNGGTTGWPRTVTLTNTGGGTLSITGLTPSGATLGPFSRAGTCAVGSNLSAGQSCTFVFTFSAPGAAGTSNASLALSTSAGNPTLALTGTSNPFSLIVHYYQSALHRAPYGGNAWWFGEVSRLQALGVDSREIYLDMAVLFMVGAEHKTLSMTDAQFVTDLYAIFANRAPDAGGFAYWMNFLALGLPRDSLVYAFRFAPEATAFIGGVAGGAGVSRAELYEVMDYYVALLGRFPDSAGFAYWRGPLQTAQCAAGGGAPPAVWNAINAETAQFVTAATNEGRVRTNREFAADLYYAMLRRDGGLGGASYWGNLLAAGMPREQVRQGFMSSPETSIRATAIAAQGCGL